MKNIFLVYMPPNNAEAMLHYRETIQERVSLARVSRFISQRDAIRLRDIFANRPIAAWGSREGTANRAKYDKMNEGDDLLIVEGDQIRFMGKIAWKTINPDLSRELWKNIRGDSRDGWDLIYFIANPIEISVPFVEFCRLFGYEENYRLRGFTTVANDKLEAFYDRYDDLYSILMRVRAGEPVIEKLPIGVQEPAGAATQLQPDDVEEALRSPIISEHIRMQWKLANLGLKAGEKIWIPPADQPKLRKLYEFNEFEPSFAAGIDLPRNYFENIDVVWKEEFRINAAFEVENSTAIYSGLLRFADLTIVAPNTTYPMFIVASADRRGRVREQLNRPSFKRLELHGKVRFLPYETIDEIDRFFANSSSGLSIALIRGKSELLA